MYGVFLFVTVIHTLIHLNYFRLGRVRELEEKRINKEMANIRSKFKGIYV
jgi:hypothetical protein